MSPATKAPREKLTLRDDVDLYLAINRYVEDHIDELELNGGALPDDLAALLDEVDASRAERVDAIAKKIDEFSGNAAAAKATKDRAARREKVWNNTIAAIKGYAKHQVERSGGEPLKGTIATLRLQKNGQASTEHTYTNEQLLAIADRGVLVTREESARGDVPSPLAKYISVERLAKLDTKAIAAAYEARRAELEVEAELIGPSDIAEAAGVDPADVCPLNTVANEIIAERLAAARAKYIAENLAAEFPGVTVTRGYHLRID
ncbi:MAG TPA: siphovirus Gp157 family protein [Gemmatimonadaceae bacterium]|nr:siphovirus Gp157 family protein [Gemmatimonadaceae bacterium]